MPPPKSLAELCLEACQKHISQLTSFGDGDFLLPPHYVRDLLSRIWDPAQLRTIEINSPQVATTEAWQRLVAKEFPVESRDKNYFPKNPTKWYKIYEKYTMERQLSRQEAEDQLRRQFQGLQDKKESRVSRLVDDPKFLPRPPKTGRTFGTSARPSGRDAPSTLRFGGGTRTKMNTGAGVLRKARRQAAEHHLKLGGVLARPVSRAPTGTVIRAPVGMVNAHRIAAQPAFRARSSLQQNAADIRESSRPNPKANYISDSSDNELWSEDEQDDEQPRQGKRVKTDVTARSYNTSQITSSGASSQPAKRPGLLSNAPKSKAKTTTFAEDQSTSTSSRNTRHSDSTGVQAKPTRPAQNTPPQSLGRDIPVPVSDSRRSPPQSRSKATSPTPSNQQSISAATKKRKAVDIFMPKKRR